MPESWKQLRHDHLAARGEDASSLVWRQLKLLEQVARGASLAQIAYRLAEIVEGETEAALCVVLEKTAGESTGLRPLTEETAPGELLRTLSGPLDRLPPSPARTAARHGRTVVGEDGEAEGEPFLEAARAAGYRSSWASPIRTPDGDVVGVIVSFCTEGHAPGPSELRVLDMTTQVATLAVERAQQTAELQRRAERLRRLYHENPTMYLTLETDGTVRSINEFGLDRLGRGEADVVGESAEALYGAGSWSRVRRALERCLDEPASIVTWEARQHGADGRLIWVREVGRSTWDERGRPVVLVTSSDITAERRARQQQQRTAETLERMMEAAPLAVLTTDGQGRVVSFNPAAESLFAVEASEAAGLPVAELFGREDGTHAQAQRLADGARQGKSFQGVRLTYPHRSGEARRLRLSVAPLTDADGAGRESGTVWMAEDVTEHDRALREQETLDRIASLLLENEGAEPPWSALVDVIADRLPVVSATVGRITEAPTVRWERLATSTNRKEAVVLPDQADADAQPFALLASLDTPTVVRAATHPQMESAVRDGVVPDPMIVVPIATSRVPFGLLVVERMGPHASDEALASTLGRVADRVAESLARQQHARQIRRSRSRLEAMIAGLSDVLLIIDPDDASIRYASPSIERVLGYTPGEIRGRSVVSLHGEDERGEARAVMQAVLEEEGSEHHGEFSWRHADGRWVAMSGTARNLCHEPAVGGILLTIRDVTERKRAERMRRQLERSERAIAMGEMAAGVAHEVRNPISSIVTLCHVLMSEGENIPEERMREIDLMEQEARRAADIMSDLLSFARTPEGDPRPIDVNELTTTIAETLEYHLRSRDTDVSLDLSTPLPKVVADERQLGQVLINLVANAEQAMREDGDGGAVTIRTGRDEEAVFVEVLDEGPGLSEEVRQRMFDPFFTTKSEEEGTGLGLSVSRSIVESHGGRLTADNRPGGGARLCLRLPLPEDATAPGSTDADGAPEAEAPGGRRGTLRVLVVDDERIFRSATARSLELEDGVRAEATDDGREAVERLRAGEVDVLLVDVRMPVMDGPTLWAVLGEEAPELRERVVYMTADAVSASTRRFLEESGAPHLVKPFTAGAALAMLRKQVGEAP